LLPICQASSPSQTAPNLLFALPADSGWPYYTQKKTPGGLLIENGKFGVTKNTENVVR
jgi:hypothetical protein